MTNAGGGGLTGLKGYSLLHSSVSGWYKLVGRLTGIA